MHRADRRSDLCSCGYGADASSLTREERRALREEWERYPDTVLVFESAPKVVVDLREIVTPEIAEGLKEIGFGEPFGVVTAFNPRGAHIGAEGNARRMRELESELRSSGDDFVRLDACSPDKTHCEHSVAIKGSRERAVEIARRWDQIAIFWWDGSAFWIVGAISEAKAVRLPTSPRNPSSRPMPHSG